MMRCSRLIRASSGNARSLSSVAGIEWLQNRQEKKLASTIRKEMKKIVKNIDTGGTSIKKVETLKRKVLTDYNYNLVEEGGDLKLHKENDEEEVTIDFDVWNPNDDDEAIQLFDAIIRKKAEDAPYFLVFTCSAHPMFGLLSVRTVPSSGDYLDQDIYDGPELPNLSETLQVGLRKYLEEKGVDEEVANFVRAYSVHKFKAQRLKTLEELTKSLVPTQDSSSK